jgi:hypothetical protein
MIVKELTIACTVHSAMTITRIVAASRALAEEEEFWQAHGKVTNIVLKSRKRQISKYPSMTASVLRAPVPEMATLSDHPVWRALQKDLKLPSRMVALNHC